MNSPYYYFLSTLFFVRLTACGPAEYAIRSGGDAAKIKTITGRELTGELLCFQDNSVYLSVMKDKTQVVRVGLNDVDVIEIEGYSNRRWVTSVILFQTIPTVLLAIAAGSVRSGYLGGALLIFGLPTALTYLAFEASTPPPPQSIRPTVIQNIEHLKKYSRFPQGLTPTQLQKLLDLSGQMEPTVLN